MARDATIEFQPIGRRARSVPGATLLEAARLAGLVLTASCGGAASCGQCRVKVLSGAVSPVTGSEKHLLSEDQLSSGLRLACCVTASGNTRVFVPRETLAADQRLQLAGDSRRVATDAVVRAQPIVSVAPGLDDARADFSRLADHVLAGEAHRSLRAGLSVLRQLPERMREGGGRFTAYVREGEVVGLGEAGVGPLGVAVDLGCTKIAGYLVDLESGDELAALGAVNPQLSYGEDLISRLVYAREHEVHARTLARLAREAIDDLIGTMAARASVRRERVADVCLVGNTAMCHLFLDLPVTHLVEAPFVAVSSCAMEVRASELDLGVAPGAYVHVLPGIGGWVGADHVAVLLALEMDRAAGPWLAIDIGTNSEIALSLPDRGLLLTTSAPSGPALEGGQIRDGMRAAPGAIEAVSIIDGEVHVKTIDDLPPVGLCGSGVIDAAAEMVRNAVVDHRGHLRRDAAGVRPAERGYEYVLVDKTATASGRDIVLTQQDIGSIQLGKAAIAAGIATLLEVGGASADELAAIFVAGAFGSFLSLESAVSIGLLPRVRGARYVQAGNAAGTGAKAALLSRAERQRAVELARRAVPITLKTQPQFDRLLARATLFSEPQ